LKRILLIIIAVISIILLLISAIAPLHTAVFRKAVSFETKFFNHNKVVSGWSGWLFYEPELTYIVNHLPESNIHAITGYDSTLRSEGMTLFVVPIPNKIDIYPEKFIPSGAPFPVKKERSVFIEKLRMAGLNVIDLEPAFVKSKKEGLLFDPYESHWTALCIEIAAKIISNYVDSVFKSGNLLHDMHYKAQDTILVTHGDLHDRLDTDGTILWYPSSVERVVCPDGKFYTDDRKADVLIIGDSFVNHGK